jgi:hypothetical protein
MVSWDVTISQKIIILNYVILWCDILTVGIMDTAVLWNSGGKVLLYIGTRYTSDMVHFFHDMPVYNYTCFGFTATFRHNTIVIGRFSRPLHIVPNIKELSLKDFDVIREYK